MDPRLTVVPGYPPACAFAIVVRPGKSATVWQCCLDIDVSHVR